MTSNNQVTRRVQLITDTCKLQKHYGAVYKRRRNYFGRFWYPPFPKTFDHLISNITIFLNRLQKHEKELGFWLKYRFCKELLLYEWNSGQLNTFFIKIRLFCNQNIGEKKCVTPMFWLQENLILMKEMGNCPEFHS